MNLFQNDASLIPSGYSQQRILLSFLKTFLGTKSGEYLLRQFQLVMSSFMGCSDFEKKLDFHNVQFSLTNLPVGQNIMSCYFFLQQITSANRPSLSFYEGLGTFAKFNGFKTVFIITEEFCLVCLIFTFHFNLRFSTTHWPLRN